MVRKISPDFFRNGYYKYGKVCWFEIGNEAYLDNPKSFNFRLDLFNASEINSRKATALKAIITEKLATQKQINLFRNYEFSCKLRELGRQSIKKKFAIKDGVMPIL